MEESRAASWFLNSIKLVDKAAPYVTFLITAFQAYQAYQNYQANNHHQNGPAGEPMHFVVRPRRNHRTQPSESNSEANLRNCDISANPTDNLASNEARSDTQPNIIVIDDDQVPSTSHQRIHPDLIELDGEESDLTGDDVYAASSTSLASTRMMCDSDDEFTTECFICGVHLNMPGREVATMPACPHQFHKKCLDGLLKRHMKCPICATHIFSPI